MTDETKAAVVPSGPFSHPPVIAAIVGALVAGVVLGVVGSAVSGVVSAASVPKPAAFSAKATTDKALTGCGMTESADGIEVSDNGNTLTVDGVGNDSGGAPIDKEFCILKALKMPDSIKQDMGQTRALSTARRPATGAIGM